MRRLRLAAVVLAAVCALAAVQAAALAAPRPQRATPGQLWNLYPLDNGAHLHRKQAPPARSRRRPAPVRPRLRATPIRAERSSANRSQAGGGGSLAPWVGAGVIAFVGLLAGGLALGVARTRGDAAGPVAVAPPPEPAKPPEPPPPPVHAEPAPADRDAALTAERREVEEEDRRAEAPREQVRTRVVKAPHQAPVAGSQPVATCQIDLWRGYVKSSFVAVTADADGPVKVAESRLFRPRGELREDDSAVKAHEELVQDLLSRGWERRGQGGEWYALRFVHSEPD
jgi:hypothetical protein